VKRKETKMFNIIKRTPNATLEGKKILISKLAKELERGGKHLETEVEVCLKLEFKLMKNGFFEIDFFLMDKNNIEIAKLDTLEVTDRCTVSFPDLVYNAKFFL
jgi:hypothetical protein